jgi:hypothetical protein
MLGWEKEDLKEKKNRNLCLDGGYRGVEDGKWFEGVVGWGDSVL